MSLMRNSLVASGAIFACRLTGMAVTPALALEVRQNLARLNALLDTLE